MNLPQGQYRSESIRRFAERVANADPYQSMKINIDIDQILLKRDPRIGEVIMGCVKRKIPFMLYADEKHYSIIDPANKLVVCYSTGRQETRELSYNDQQFANRVRIAYAVYDKVYLPPLALVEDIESTAIPANRPTMISMIPIFILFFLFAACQTQEKKEIIPPVTVDSAMILVSDTKRLEPLRNDMPVLYYSDSTAMITPGRKLPKLYTPHPVRFIDLSPFTRKLLQNTTKPRQIAIDGKPYMVIPIANGEYELYPLFDTTADPNYILVPRPKMPKPARITFGGNRLLYDMIDWIDSARADTAGEVIEYIDTTFSSGDSGYRVRQDRRGRIDTVTSGIFPSTDSLRIYNNSLFW